MTQELYSLIPSGYGGIVALTSLIAFHKYRHWRKKNSSLFADIQIPPSIKCFTHSEFTVIAAICDTLIPELSEDEVIQESKLKSLPFDPTIYEKDFFVRTMSIFKMGAINNNVHVMAAEMLQKCASANDIKKTSGLLNLLGNSIGCFLLTGYLAPYPQLSISNRIKVMQNFRNSLIPDLRVAFQTFKRLTVYCFLDTLREAEWKEFGYDPTTTVSKEPRVTHTLPRLPNPCAPPETQNWIIDTEVVVIGR